MLTAIIVAAGCSRRMGFDKLFATIAGKPVIAHSIDAFERTASVSEIIVVAREDRHGEVKEIVRDENFEKVRSIIAGGENRQDHPLLRVFHTFFTAFPLFCRQIFDTVVGGLMHFIICWALHQKEREVLLGGILPWGIDAVVFCWRCDRMRGRAVRVLQMTPQGLHACSAHSAH